MKRRGFFKWLGVIAIAPLSVIPESREEILVKKIYDEFQRLYKKHGPQKTNFVVVNEALWR